MLNHCNAMVHTLAPFHPTAASVLMLGLGGACRKVAFLRFSCLGPKGQTKPWGSVALLPLAVCCSGQEKAAWKKEETWPLISPLWKLHIIATSL